MAKGVEAKKREAAAKLVALEKAHWRTPDRFEGLARRASQFASSPWGTHVAFGLLAFWLGASVVVGWRNAYDMVEEVATMSSFLLLFLLQRAQAKDTLAMQAKLNELLAAVNKASPQLINLEDRSEEEVREVHDLYQELRTARSESHSIEEVREQVLEDLAEEGVASAEAANGKS
ncbi:Low affinity iron permease [Aquisphaera giovannonii]|uniref:Low affinity iron permease n=1 Tax=Aquisphaera giovannonii TaxID=406548 RepID=A0A5B9VUU3_9BACT|nr:low affinity iron permease family protein [Aquisphaera giovannonii]QEH31879.1 Low affinity iron permease [Aquisphaera giovannonii]